MIPFRWPILIALAAIFLAKLGLSLWAVGRGFDIGDEGFFLLNLNDPAIAPPLFEFYKLLTLFDPPLRFEVVPTRLLRLATELCGTLLLTAGVFRWAAPRYAGVAAAGLLPFVLVVGLGSLLTVGSRSLSYNDATIFLLSTSCGAFFVLASIPTGNSGRARRAGWAIVVGFLVGFLLFVKFPASLLMIAALGVASAAVRGWTLRERGEVTALGLLGFLLAVLFFVVANGGASPLLAKWAYAQEISRVTDYRVAGILRVYLDHDWPTHVNNLRLGVSFASTFGLAWWVLRRWPERLDRSLAVALLVGAIVLGVGVVTFHPPTVHPSLLYLFGLSLLLGCVGWWVAWRSGGGGARGADFILLLLPFALPFLGIAGTNVALTLKLPSHAAPLFVLFAVLGFELMATARLGRFCFLALALLAAVTSGVFVQHHLMRPYGLANDIFLQTEPVAGLPGVKVDPATREFLERLAAEMAEAGFKPGDPVIALDFMPSLVHFLGGRSPAFPFYHFDNPALNCFAINRIEPSVRPFLILGRGMSRDQHECIEAFDYPDDFRPVATIRNPYELVYPKFFGGPEMPYIHIFAPRELPARSPARSPTRSPTRSN